MQNLKNKIETWLLNKQLDGWKDFPNTMWAQGFEMDTHESFVNLFGEFSLNDERGRQDVIEKLQSADAQIVGNFIFSHWRFLTHWCCCYNPDEELPFFKQLFAILLSKEK